MDKLEILEMLKDMAKGRYEIAREYRDKKYDEEWEYWSDTLECQADVLTIAGQMIESGDTKDRDLEAWEEALENDVEIWKEKRGIGK